MSEGNFNEKGKLVKGPRWAPDTKTDWPTDCRSQINFNFNLSCTQQATSAIMAAGLMTIFSRQVRIIKFLTLNSEKESVLFES
jgi:hypothetical protein